MSAHRALIAQVITKLSPARVTVVAAHSKGWFSATFAGERHEFTFLVEGEGAVHAAHSLQRTITSEEFDINGYLVADILINNLSADETSARIDIEALTVKVD
jgi:hypothetical protein